MSCAPPAPMDARRGPRSSGSSARPATSPDRETRCTAWCPDRRGHRMTVLLLVKAMLVSAVVLVFLATVGTITYRITEAGLEVLILGRVVRRLPLTDIEEVHRRGALIHENWSSLKFWNSVTIRKRRGLF